MTLGPHKVKLVPFALGIVTTLGENHKKYRFFQLLGLKPRRESWEEINGVRVSL